MEKAIDGSFPHNHQKNRTRRSLSTTDRTRSRARTRSRPSAPFLPAALQRSRIEHDKEHD